MKIIISKITLLILIFANTSYIVDAKEATSPYSLNDNFKLYKEREENICGKYKEKIQIVKLDEIFVKLTPENQYLKDIKKIHKENMNLIYKCGVITTQNKALLLIKHDLLKPAPDLEKVLGSKIDRNIKLNKRKLKQFKCITSQEKSSIIKLKILKQATYETCKYISYLEYLKEYNDYIEHIGNFNKGKDEEEQIETSNNTVLGLIQIKNQRIKEIDTEIAHTYKIFPLAFHAYTEYENNVIIHFLLQIIKEDYMVLRQKLHDALNPISQVVYKIQNAMSK